MNTEEKILKILFEEPNKEFHIRNLARLTKLNPSTVSYTTEKLAKESILLREKSNDLNTVIVKADTESQKYKLKKKSYNLQKIFDSGLVTYLNTNLAYPTIILFGSYAKAENHQESDIDLFIISEEKKKPELGKYEAILKAEIQVFIHTKKEFIKLMKTNSELINNVVNGTILSGFLELA